MVVSNAKIIYNEEGNSIAFDSSLTQDNDLPGA